MNIFILIFKKYNSVSKKYIIFNNQCKEKMVRYPPKKSIVVNIHIKTILAYSAKKKKTNIAAECSVIKPETNSDSASARSKGALFVSAIHPIKNIINIGNKGKTNNTTFCASILTVKFRLPVNKITNNIAELSINS